MGEKDGLYLFSHHPQGLDGDRLGFSSYARTIYEILAGLTADKTGLTIGIFGDWGSGKSTVLKMVGELLQDPRSTSRPFLPDRRRGRRHLARSLLSISYRTIGWRSRKGKRLRLVRKLWFKSKRIKPRRYRPLIVPFQAWRYSNDQIWVAFLQTIAKQIRDELRPIPRVITKTKLWRHHIRWARLLGYTVWLLFCVLLVAVGLGIGLLFISGAALSPEFNTTVDNVIALLQNNAPILQGTIAKIQSLGNNVTPNLPWLMPALGVSSSAAAFALLVAALWNGAKKALDWLFTVQIVPPRRFLRHKLDTDTPLAVELFRQELEHLIQDIGWKRPIVVLIDDLDRAPVSQIVPVLEAMKHFGELSNKKRRKNLETRRAPIAFVLAADRDAIQGAVAAHHEEFWATHTRKQEPDRFAREYVEKIVQIPFELPPVSTPQLVPLLQIEPAPPSRKSPNVRYLASALEEAQSVLSVAARGNPRQTIQAINSFQMVWRIVQRRHLRDIDPVCMAALIAIRYLWPTIFDQIFQVPDLFFDLRALASHERNEVCRSTEIEEVLSLGCPKTQAGAMIEQECGAASDLMRLLRSFSLPAGLNTDKLLCYLTLTMDEVEATEERRSKLEEHQSEYGAAWMSGDPSLIKFALRVAPPEFRKRVLWLVEFLEPAEPSLKDKSSPQAQQIEENQIKALFALGRLENGDVLEEVARVAGDREHYSKAVRDRAVFALAHLAEQSDRRQLDALCALAELLGVKEPEPPGALRVKEDAEDQETSDFLRARVLRLLGLALKTCSADEKAQRVSPPIIQLGLNSDKKLVQKRAIEIIRQERWYERVFAEVEQGRYTDQGLKSYLEIVGELPEGASSLSEDIRTHLAGFAVNPESPYKSQAFKDLAQQTDPNVVVLSMADVAARAAVNSTDSRIRDQTLKICQEAIQVMGQRQAVSKVEWQETVLKVEWQESAWDQVWNALSQSPGVSGDVWLAFVNALCEPLSENPENEPDIQAQIAQKQDGRRRYLENVAAHSGMDNLAKKMANQELALLQEGPNGPETSEES